MKSSEPIKQHYVPQAQLERFEGVDGKLLVFDKFSQKIFPAGKRDIAQENHFYDIPKDLMTQEIVDLGIKPQSLEKALSKIDSRYKIAVDNLIELHPKKTIPDELREELAYCLAWQIFRTRDFRNLVIEGHTKLRQAIADDLVKTKFPNAPRRLYPKVQLKTEHEPILHAQVMFDPKNIAKMTEVLFKHIWIIGVNKTTDVLYTSDNPIVKHHHIKELDALGINGWQSPGVEIVFPLAPRLILTMCDREVFKFYKQDDGKRKPVYIKNVTYFNSLQVIHSHRQVYSSINNFDLAKRMCIEEPHLCVPDEDRLDIAITNNPAAYYLHRLKSALIQKDRKKIRQ